MFINFLCGEYIIHKEIHSAPNNLSCQIEAFINIPIENVHSFSLLYRPKGSLEYIETPMRLVGHLKYIGEIPVNAMSRDNIEYYLRLDLLYQNLVTFPLDNAKYNPITIEIESSSEKTIPVTPSEIDNFDIIGLDSDIVIISPQPGEIVRNKDFFIALSYFRKKNIDPKKIKIYLDDVDISNQAHVDSTYLTISPKYVISGEHKISVQLSNIFNQKYENLIWSFTLLPKDLNEISIMKRHSGRIWANYNGGYIRNTSTNMGELNALYEIDLDWIQCTVRYIKSSLENKYDQSKDKYSLYLKNNIMSIKLGDSYPFLDRYGLQGHRVRGINYKFNYKFFSLNFIKGTTARAVQGDPANHAIEAIIDSTNDMWEISLSRNNYTFQQDLLASKIGLQFGKNIYWDFNFMKVSDNVESVEKEINNAQIEIVAGTCIDTVISYDSLSTIDSFNDCANLNDLQEKNWIGNKPLYNSIYGSNIRFAFDDNRVKIHSGFSISYLNRNMWNKIDSITELDDFLFDQDVDGYFLNLVELDYSLTDYEDYFTYGLNQQPMIPLLLRKDGKNFSDIFNMSNLNRYFLLKLHYLGHKLEIGSIRNGPDYYSILNPSLKVNYKENYFSDRINLFNNKCLFFYKKSRIIEGLYLAEKSPIEIDKSIINVSLYPGLTLPNINLDFSTSTRNNNVKNMKITEQIIEENSVYTDTTDRRINVSNKQFNISITKDFMLWVKQSVNLNLHYYNQTDLVKPNILDQSQYVSKNFSSNSYGINIKSFYNDFWESLFNYNVFSYSYGDEYYAYSQESYMQNTKIMLIHYPMQYIDKISSNISFSNGNNSKYLPNINYGISIESEFIENFRLNLSLNHFIKFNIKKSDTFIRARLSYNII